MVPTFLRERTLWKQGHSVAGVDEVGRGAWAGPLVAGAVIFTSDAVPELAGLKDSKQLLAYHRQQFSVVIERVALTFAIGVVTVEELDAIGVGEANRLALRRALAGLHPQPTVALVDAFTLRDLPFQTEGVVKGDEKISSIAAASVIAKVARDAMMVALHEQDPRYGFDRHKGYGTALHRDRLAQHGPSVYHRGSFAPIRQYKIKKSKIQNNT